MKKEKLKSLIEASAQGNERAALLLYYFYYSADNDCCIQFLETAVNKGSISARYEYAIHQLEGDIVADDTESALLSLEYCANHGYMEAIEQLTYMYSIGYKVKADPERARYWRERKTDSDFATDQEQIHVRIEVTTPNDDKSDDERNKQDFEGHEAKLALGIVSKEISIFDVTTRRLSELMDGKNMQIILSNNGEKSFVFSRLLMPKISQGKSGVDERFKLQIFEDCKTIDDSFMHCISGSVLDDEKCRIRLGKMVKETNLSQAIRLDINDREFYILDSSQGDRWVCSNGFYSTHLMVIPKDISLDNDIDDYTEVSLWEDEEKGGYCVVSKESNEIIGRTSSTFETVLEQLLEKQEISSMPVVIKGIELCKQNGELMTAGMGYMEFGLDD